MQNRSRIARKRLLLLTLLLLSACLPLQKTTLEKQGTAEQDGNQANIALEYYQLPAQLGLMTLVGQLSAEQSQTRLFSYQQADSTESIRVMLYPVPEQWSGFPPIRLIAGHYGQVRQEELQRLRQAQYGSIIGRHEGLYVSDLLEYPVAEVILSSKQQPHLPSTVVLLGTAPPLFIRMARKTTQKDIYTVLQQSRQHMETLIQELTTQRSVPAPASATP